MFIVKMEGCFPENRQERQQRIARGRALAAATRRQATLAALEVAEVEELPEAETVAREGEGFVECGRFSSTHLSRSPRVHHP